MPTRPEAAWECPRLGLVDVSKQGCSRLGLAYAAASALTSTGSPSRVPVPWVTTWSMSAGSIPLRSRASRISFSCASPEGAVMPLVRPSPLTALASTRASGRRPSRRASDSRCRTTTLMASPGTIPSARRSKARHIPDGESMPAPFMASMKVGVANRFTPATTAMSQSPTRNELHA